MPERQTDTGFFNEGGVFEEGTGVDLEKADLPEWLKDQLVLDRVDQPILFVSVNLIKPSWTLEPYSTAE